jgi:hypothetical protein
VLVPNAGVIEVGTPVNAGDSSGAFSARALVNPVLTMDPPTNKLLLNDESEATRKPAFNDTSPDEVIIPVKDGDDDGADDAIKLINAVFTIVP